MIIFYIITVVTISKLLLTFIRRNTSTKTDQLEFPNPLPKPLGKNRWLYPKDDLGKMEEGVE